MKKLLLALALLLAACGEAPAPTGTVEQSLGAGLNGVSVPSGLTYYTYVPGYWPGEVTHATMQSTNPNWSGYPGLLPDRAPVYTSVISRNQICNLQCGGSGCCPAAITQTQYDQGVAAFGAAQNAVFNATGGNVYFLDSAQFGQNADVTFDPSGLVFGGDQENHLHDFDGRYIGRSRCGDGTGSAIRPLNESGPLRGVCTRGFAIGSSHTAVRARYDEYAAFWCLNIAWQQYLNAHVTHQLLHYFGYPESTSVGNIMSDLEPSSLSAPSGGCPNGTMQWSSNIRNSSVGGLSLLQSYYAANPGLPE
jgi:hypothetical protein